MNYKENNKVKLIGTIAEPLKRELKEFGGLYTTIVEAKRLSGTVDRVPVRIPEENIKKAKFKVGSRVSIEGECRSYTREHHLNIFVYAKKIFAAAFFEDEDVNEIEFEGYVSKCPNYRRTPLTEREITDLFIASPNNAYKSSYIPCIAWGAQARYVENLQLGRKVHIEGRIQSRDYLKKISEEEVETKTAIEVSCDWVSVI